MREQDSAEKGKAMSRDELSGYPCPHWDGGCEDDCPEDMGIDCDSQAVYRRYIALRKAVLGDMTVEEAARAYRSVAPEAWNHPFLRNAQHFLTLADVVEGI